jgi:hypothetical protein
MHQSLSVLLLLGVMAMPLTDALAQSSAGRGAVVGCSRRRRRRRPPRRSYRCSHRCGRRKPLARPLLLAPRSVRRSAHQMADHIRYRTDIAGDA